MVAESPPEAAPAKPPDPPSPPLHQLPTLLSASLASLAASLLVTFRLVYGRTSPLQSNPSDPTTSKRLPSAPLMLLPEVLPPPLSLQLDPPSPQIELLTLPLLESSKAQSPSTYLVLLLELTPWWVVSMPLVHMSFEIIAVKVCEAKAFGLTVAKEPFNFSVNTYFDALRGSTTIRQWEFQISGVTLDLLCLKLDSFYSCLRCFAAWCRILPWFNLMQSVVYLHPSMYYESLLLTRSDPHVVWVSAPMFSSPAMERNHFSIRVWWCFMVELPPMPPVPPDPPDSILSPRCLLVFWICESAVLTLSSLGDMSFVTAFISIAFIPPLTQGSILSSLWNVWNLTGLSSIARCFVSRLKLLSLHLPLYEVARLVLSSPLPLYEDSLPLYEDPFPLYENYLPLYEDLDTLPLYEDLVPVYREFLDSSSLPVSFTEFFSLLDPPFVLNGCDTRSVIKGSNYRCLFASVAILEMGNCALAAVLFSGV